jgi:hypothetical protein
VLRDREKAGEKIIYLRGGVYMKYKLVHIQFTDLFLRGCVNICATYAGITSKIHVVGTLVRVILQLNHIHGISISCA